ncbi:DUF1832 domain-containing protein [Chryseobacterium sp. H3056]|uniref:DUF1832 domain-containing protein n=1 Tax=Kaistella daneshvariae TaxID=2487074 RepID=A0A3N0WXM8_9FLAO|nr:DndE family protein [Kaistella daneshvariae]ROI09836.1 DUF1832 domain-containing protein [Kaistella daneshvariae]
MRITLSKENDEAMYRLKNLYNFKNESIASRIAFALSLQVGKLFNVENDIIPKSDGKEFRDEKALFGTLINDTSNYAIFKSILDQHYKRNLYEEEFAKLFKIHLNHGLQLWVESINNNSLSQGGHIETLIQFIKKGLNLRANTTHISLTTKKTDVKEFANALSFEIGNTENGDPIIININDLREFDNRNIAIAGMAGSGKTQLIKDVLYQISKNSNHELKFIFFDYKGEGNPVQLKPFLDATQAHFVDIVNDGGLDFNPFMSINLEERQRPFSVRAFVDTVSTFVPRMGVSQENILITLINDLLDRKNGAYPTVAELFEDLESYYEENNIRQDTLYSVIRDLSTNIFNCDPNNPSLLDNSLYLNLPPALSDTLRQLVVFLLLRYFNSYFSSTNDCEPKDYIFPLRYVIVIDEAHIYLKNKNARKALEDLLRLLRSKGVIVVMLSQGVEDYKTKDFDFASQVKLPICLNIQNKDYKYITNFLGTPTSKYKLETEIKKLESGKGLISLPEPKTFDLRQWHSTFENEIL